MPTAAETKFWTVRPDICIRCPTAASPEYHCQFVFVVNETAVFQAPSAGQPGEAEGQRQVLLQPAEAEEQQDADQREAEHRHRVGAPVLVGVGIDAQHPVRRPLDREVLGRGVDVGEVPTEQRHGDRQCDDAAPRSGRGRERGSSLGQPPVQDAHQDGEQPEGHEGHENEDEISHVVIRRPAQALTRLLLTVP